MPKPKRKRAREDVVITLRIPGHLMERLEALSQASGEPIKELVANAIKTLLNGFVMRSLEDVAENYGRELRRSRTLVKPELPPKPLRRDDKPRPNEPRGDNDGR